MYFFSLYLGEDPTFLSLWSFCFLMLATQTVNFPFSSAVSDEAGLQHVAQELEAKAILPFSFEK